MAHNAASVPCTCRMRTRLPPSSLTCLPDGPFPMSYMPASYSQPSMLVQSPSHTGDAFAPPSIPHQPFIPANPLAEAFMQLNHETESQATNHAGLPHACTSQLSLSLNASAGPGHCSSSKPSPGFVATHAHSNQHSPTLQKAPLGGCVFPILQDSFPCSTTFPFGSEDARSSSSARPASSGGRPQEFLSADAPSQERDSHAPGGARKRARQGASDSPHSTENAHIKRVRGSDGVSKKVCAIPRVPYVRHQQPKKLCPHCDDHPDGFRGEHELKRHVDRAHAREGRRKMWICVDPTTDGKFLANCKKCRSRKKYGAYYNAAAHLRRAHFNPRPRGPRSKDTKTEPRGGRGGGDDPPMHELKQHWMKEVDDYTVTSPEDLRDSSQDAPSPAQDTLKTPEPQSPLGQVFTDQLGRYNGCLAPDAFVNMTAQEQEQSCTVMARSDGTSAPYVGGLTADFDYGDFGFDTSLGFGHVPT